MADIIRRGKPIIKDDSKVDGFKYWDDPRWAEIKRLRATGDQADAARASELEEKLKKDYRVS